MPRIASAALVTRLSCISPLVHMKSAIVIDENLPTGLLANAAACIATGLFKDESEAYGPEIQGNDHVFIPITQIPILVLKKGKRDFEEILRRIDSTSLKVMIFTQEGQSTAKYEEYINRVTGKNLEDLSIVGIGMIGDDADVTKVAGDLPLLR